MHYSHYLNKSVQLHRVTTGLNFFISFHIYLVSVRKQEFADVNISTIIISYVVIIRGSYLVFIFPQENVCCGAHWKPCPDPENFVRGGPTLTTFVVVYWMCVCFFAFFEGSERGPKCQK